MVYSGTLGLKHNPALLVRLARAVRDEGRKVRLVVVNEGPAVEVLQDEARRLDVPVTLLPFQPYERLPEVLGSGDVLVVLLEQEAGAFSVPSKTLSYLCAGRPVLGLMPGENLASSLVTRAGGLVLPPADGSLAEAASWVSGVLADPELRSELGEASRDLAEQEFALAGCATRFERLLAAQVGATTGDRQSLAKLS
nr:glycosyltransferase [Nocardioides kongjuensis]